MDRKIKKVAFHTLPEINLKRVAGYSRVSSGKDAMLQSLSAQVSYYSSYIQSHPDWVYCGVYADEARTGTKDTREEFQRLLEDCRAGKIDMIITKSISRFARNTVTFLETVRDLKSRGIDVYFEEQNIHSMSTSGELMLTILASFAQEESLSASENQKWRVLKNFEEGLPWSHKIYGYKFVGDKFVIIESEAKVVRLIYDWYLDGLGIVAIVNRLNQEEYRARTGNVWSKTTVRDILNNYHYTGNLILQKTFRENHITKRKMKNIGQLPQYRIEDSHEAIIPVKTFEAVQREQKRRAEKFAGKKKPTKNELSGLIKCSCCGKSYRRKINPKRVTWICLTYNTFGKAKCPSKQIPEETLFSTIGELGIECNEIKQIYAIPGNRLKFELNNGECIYKTWTDHSRKEYWTEEKRAEARQREFERMRKLG